MYKITVPISSSGLKRKDRDRTLAELKRFDTERVFLGLGGYIVDPERRKSVMEELADNCRYFKEHGFEVGAWTAGIGVEGKHNFGKMRAVTGEEIEHLCPSNADYLQLVAECIKDIAKCGVDLIMLDDDLRYGFLPFVTGCLCDNHIAEINQITGEEKTREEIGKYILTGSKNKFRDAYLQANGNVLRRYAAVLRAAVDEVNPDIRLGACSCMSSWDVDGVDAFELATIFAGKTRPYVRLIGAPYWAVKKSWGNSLQDVVELERMESVWTKKGDIEIFAEGDAYPRPRSSCPASYLEGFDTAIRASGCTEGILKYGMDYISNADYETGYAKFHERNREVYKKIDQIFRPKTSCGVRVYEFMHKISDMVVPTKVNDHVSIDDLFFSKAARTLAYNTIPTIYEGEGVCGIVFGENARHISLEDVKKGMILDIEAAEILMERGVDIGLVNIGDAINGTSGRYVKNDNHIMTHDVLFDETPATVYDVILKDGAEVLSEMSTSKGMIPMSYRYENAEGSRFMVFNLNTRFGSFHAICHYGTSRQIEENIRWISGKKLPAYVYGNPAMYIQCKEKDDALAVGLWNYYADIAIDSVVELGDVYSEITFINGSGRLEGDKVYLEDIPAFGFAGFEVRK